MKSLQQAIQARDELLKTNPKLLKKQKEIDEILDKVGTDPKLRLDALSIWMSANLIELAKLLKNLSDIIKK